MVVHLILSEESGFVYTKNLTLFIPFIGIGSGSTILLLQFPTWSELQQERIELPLLKSLYYKVK